MPNLPADLLVHQTALTELYKKFDGVLAKEKIDDWLLQFNPEHRRLALRLALKVSYFSQDEVFGLCKKLYSRIDALRVRKPCFVGFGHSAKSGSLISYYFCKANGLSTKSFISFEDIPKKYKGHDAIILIDDFLGRGDQAIHWLTNMAVPLQDLPQLYFLVLVGFDTAKDRAEKITKVHVEVEHQLTDMDRAFFARGVFEDIYEARHAREIFRGYGEALEPEYPLGYGNDEALVTLFYNTPNNTLPIFWSKHKWISLFERHESQQSNARDHFPPSSTRNAKHLDSCAEYLSKHEAIFDWEFPDGKEAFQLLNSRQEIAVVECNRSRLYALPELAISAGIASGVPGLANLGSFCNLKITTIWDIIERRTELFRLQLPNIGLLSLKGQLLVLDWSDTLVDEYALDEAICSAIPLSGHSDDNDRATVKFRELLTDLEQLHSHLWYDYIYLGRQFGKTTQDLADLHTRNRDLINPLCDVAALVTALRQAGLRIALSTNCVAPVLEWRAKLLGLRLDALFDFVVTSDITQNVRDKGTNLDHLIDKSGVSASRMIVVGNSFSKDILPAKLRGMSTVWLRGPIARERRSYWGTPELPVSPQIYEPTRAAVRDRAADIMILDISHLLSVVSVPESAKAAFALVSTNSINALDKRKPIPERTKKSRRRA